MKKEKELKCGSLPTADIVGLLEKALDTKRMLCTESALCNIRKICSDLCTKRDLYTKESLCIEYFALIDHIRRTSWTD